MGAALPFQVRLVGIVASMLFFWIPPLMMALDMARAQLGVALFNFAWYLPLALVLTAQYGLVGAASSVSLVWAMGALSLIFIVKKLTTPRPQEVAHGQ
jgi:hypothetical protein